MWYWFCLIGSVTLVIGAVAAILWWAWRQETASRYADTLDRRFAKDKTEPKPLKAYLDWVNWRGALEQRVTALEEQQEVFLLHIPNLWKEVVALKRFTGLADIPSPPTESHIKGDPLGVERDSTTLPTLRFSQSGPPIIKGGHAERLSEFAEPEDVLT